MHSLFIVGTNTSAWFNVQANLLGNNGLSITTLGISATGLTPGTHGWCAVTLGAEKAAAVEQILLNNPDKAADINWTQYDLGTQPGWPSERLVALGLKLIQTKLP